MKENIEDNEIYFLGSKRKRHFSKIHGMLIALIIFLAAGYFIMYHQGKGEEDAGLTLDAGTLETVSVLPKNSKMPKFNGKEDISAFVDWVQQNLNYPLEAETKEATVIVEFVVLKNGKLGNFKVIKSTGDKAFQEEVLGLLRRSPLWEPAELTGGQKVNMKCTLPVVFRNRW